ncbi:acyltransferase 3 [Desmospora sp. 8437]|nr:acyltransferase 3 [Desmospora sp. 8437]
MLSAKKIPPLLDVTLDETDDIRTEDAAGYPYCNYMRVPPGYTCALSVQVEEEASFRVPTHKKPPIGIGGLDFFKVDSSHDGWPRACVQYLLPCAQWR